MSGLFVIRRQRHIVVVGLEQFVAVGKLGRALGSGLSSWITSLGQETSTVLEPTDMSESAREVSVARNWSGHIDQVMKHKPIPFLLQKTVL